MRLACATIGRTVSSKFAGWFGQRTSDRRFRVLCAALPTRDGDRRRGRLARLLGPHARKTPASAARRGRDEGRHDRWHAFSYNQRMDPLVLTVDMAGLPQAWVVLEEAITYHAKQMVAWSLGAVVREFRGGFQRDGTRSRIATKSILAIKGSAGRPLAHTPGLTNPMLFARDRQVCAYCGGRFMSRCPCRAH